MRTLKNILEASVLGDIETTLSNTDNAYEVMYPVPKTKDFFSEGKFQNVVWQCPELVKKYKHLFNQDAEFPAAWNIDEATGIILRIRVPSERNCAKTISICFVKSPLLYISSSILSLPTYSLNNNEQHLKYPNFSKDLQEKIHR